MSTAQPLVSPLVANGIFHSYKGIVNLTLIGFGVGVIFIDVLMSPFYLGGTNVTGGVLAAAFLFLYALVLNGMHFIFWELLPNFGRFAGNDVWKKVSHAIGVLCIGLDLVFDIGFVTQMMYNYEGMSSKTILPPVSYWEATAVLVTLGAIVFSVFGEVIMSRYLSMLFDSAGIFGDNFHSSSLYDGHEDFKDFPASDTRSGNVPGDPLIGN